MGHSVLAAAAAGGMMMGRALMTVLLLLVCWYCRPAAAVEIRIARGLDTNSTFMAPRPTPPEEKPIPIPPHNYSKPAHNYTHAVIGQSKHKVWIRQLHYKVGSRVRVDQVTLTEVFNASKAALYLRGRTTDGSGVCLVEEHPKNTTKSASASRPLDEQMVSLEGPMAATKGRLVPLCRSLPVYKVHRMQVHTHKHKERRARYAYKTTMRVLAFIWRNRRILGLPFGVHGDFEYRG